MKYVVVIGSKPDSKLPVVDPECVYTASGAVTRGVYYREKYGTFLASIQTYAVFKMNNETVLESVAEVKPDKMVLRCTENIFEDQTGFLAKHFSEDQIEYVLRPEQFAIQKRLLGWRIFPAMLERNDDLRGKLRYFKDRILIPWLFQSIKPHLKPAAGCSTGLWTAFYALSRHPEATVIISGIGLQAGEHFYPDERFDFSAIMGRIDSYVVRHLPSRIKERLMTTEERMHTVGGIKMWNGETVDV